MLEFLRRLLVPEQKSLDVSNAWALIDLGAGTAAGLSVSPETCLRCPAVRGAVAVLAESVAQLPLILYRRGDDGSKERAVDHSLYEILHDQANDWSSAFEFRQQLMVDVLLHGNAFAHIGRSRASGAIVELVRLPPRAVQVDADDATGEPTYWVNDNTGRRQIDRADLLHLQALGGEAPVMLAREAIGLSLAMEQHQSRLFANGARPAGVLRLKGRIPPATLERLQQDFAAKWSGFAGSGRTMILEEDASFDPLTFSSVDLQMLELRRFQTAEIARALRIPLHLLGDWERATWSNAEVAGQQFLSFSLLPWLKLWEGALRRALLTPEERRDHYFEFLVDDLVRADIAARFEAYSKAVTNGFMAINEVRASENRPPMAGGDELRVPLNTEPVGADQEEEPANA
jgi:HK97 family phage portal protein